MECFDIACSFAPRAGRRRAEHGDTLRYGKRMALAETSGAAMKIQGQGNL
jgi:hypothetical protein